MNDKATQPDADDGDRDDAVIAADATGMIAGERAIATVEIEEALDGGNG